MPVLIVAVVMDQAKGTGSISVRQVREVEESPPAIRGRWLAAGRGETRRPTVGREPLTDDERRASSSSPSSAVNQ